LTIQWAGERFRLLELSWPSFRGLFAGSDARGEWHGEWAWHKGRTDLISISRMGSKQRAANSPEVPPELVEFMLPCKTTKMQSELLCRGKIVILRCEHLLPVAMDLCSILNIHKMVTTCSANSCVRIVPNRAMSIRPTSATIFLSGERLIFAFEIGKTVFFGPKARLESDLQMPDIEQDRRDPSAPVT
jgi:hypothetical protein